LYIKQAEAAAVSGNVSQAAANFAKAQQYDRSVTEPSELLVAYAGEAVKAFEESDSDVNFVAALGKLQAIGLDCLE